MSHATPKTTLITGASGETTARHFVRPTAQG
jgi:hypothetical protein